MDARLLNGSLKKKNGTPFSRLYHVLLIDVPQPTCLAPFTTFSQLGTNLFHTSIVARSQSNCTKIIMFSSMVRGTNWLPPVCIHGWSFTNFMSPANGCAQPTCLAPFGTFTQWGANLSQTSIVARSQSNCTKIIMATSMLQGTKCGCLRFASVAGVSQS